MTAQLANVIGKSFDYIIVGAYLKLVRIWISLILAVVITGGGVCGTYASQMAIVPERLPLHPFNRLQDSHWLFVCPRTRLWKYWFWSPEKQTWTTRPFVSSDILKEISVIDTSWLIQWFLVNVQDCSITRSMIGCSTLWAGIVFATSHLSIILQVKQEKSNGREFAWGRYVLQIGSTDPGSVWMRD